jgi:hypothetical protein
VKADNREMEADVHVAKDNCDAELEVALQCRRARPISNIGTRRTCSSSRWLDSSVVMTMQSGTSRCLRAERSANRR